MQAEKRKEKEWREKEYYIQNGSMKSDIMLEGEISREKLKDFAQYIIPFIRDFSFSEEGQRYISEWMRKHPRFGDDEEDIYDDDEEDDDY